VDWKSLLTVSAMAMAVWFFPVELMATSDQPQPAPVVDFVQAPSPVNQGKACCQTSEQNFTFKGSVC